MDYEILKKRSKNLAYEVSSLRRCEDEPIAYCGAIQPAGLLVVANCENLIIRAASSNWSEFVGDSAASMLGKSLHDYLKFEGGHGPETSICDLIHTGKVKVSFLNPNNQIEIGGSCYRVKSDLVIEFEISKNSWVSDTTSILKNLVHQTKSSNTIEEAAQFTAEALKELSGIDRVMIYRFDPEWNGQVIAEAKEERLETFLHLRYPAYDIPPQARQLFFQNQSRMIVDINAEPYPIVTNGFHPAEIDLSYAILRAVSPIHIQYLSNMGVTASFSAPIRVGNRLWGLIACHHYSGAKHLNQDTRSAFELAAQITSGKISDLSAQRKLANKAETLILTQNLLAGIASGKSAIAAFQEAEAQLLNLMDSSGAYVRIAGEELVLGTVPSPETREAIIEKVSSFQELTVWKTNSLCRDLQIDPDPNAAGALAVPFSLGFEDMLIWFRPEELNEVRWAGQPRSKETAHPGTLERLSPRSSFAEWREKVENQARAWNESNEDCAQYFLFGFVQGIFSKAKALSNAYQELESASKSKDEFIGMISHELRTPLSAIIGWVDILREYPQCDQEAYDAIEVIERNAKTQVGLINDLLDVSRIISGKLRIDPQPDINITQIVRNVIESLRPTAIAKSITVDVHAMSEERMTADPDRLRQIIWNLLTNAVKFTPKGGHISVSAQKLKSEIEIKIADNGIGIEPSKLSMIFGRFAQAKASSANLGGLGLGLSIVKSLVELHGGKIEAFSEGEGYGSQFTVTLPVYALAHSFEASNDFVAKSNGLASTKLAGIHVLVAEDQADSRAALKRLVERNGGTVVAVENGKEALQALKTGAFDLILSDVGMPEMNGYELMQSWREEERKFNIPKIPAVALTAYASSKDRTQALEAGFQSHVPKPVDRAELLAVIDSLRVVPKKPFGN
jgi:two-component system, chemotaxis family, sensor kinase Cph1